MDQNSKYYVILNEKILREIKYRFLYTHYRPNFFVNLVSSKFYSRYESSKNIDSIEDDPRVMNYFKNVELARGKGPKDKYLEPVTESQVIGWYHESDHAKQLKSDKRFYHPIVTSSYTKLMDRIHNEK